MLSLGQKSELVKRISNRFGFSFCGISKAAFLEEEAGKLERWLTKGFQGEMSYMENHFDKRLNPTLLVPGARSVISLLFNYFPESSAISEQEPKISRYAYGEDYHLVIKEKLFSMVAELKLTFGNIDGRVFVDSAPVLERAWAAKSGLGWIGKNAMLINKHRGSYFFLAQIICDLELEEDGPIKDYCGTCTACIDACPTYAIIDHRIIDSNRCISYLTIELRKEISNKFSDQMQGWMFGCDICQEVCPWNRFSTKHQEEKFKPIELLSKSSLNDWLEMTEEVFHSNFGKSALQRTGLEGLKRNANFLFKKKN